MVECFSRLLPSCIKLVPVYNEISLGLAIIVKFFEQSRYSYLVFACRVTTVVYDLWLNPSVKYFSSCFADREQERIFLFLCSFSPSSRLCITACFVAIFAKSLQRLSLQNSPSSLQNSFLQDLFPRNYEKLLKLHF